MARRFWPGGPGQGTGVDCPACVGAELLLHLSCLRTRVTCAGCGEDFSLAELARRLDDEAFSALELALGRRLADRV